MPVSQYPFALSPQWPHGRFMALCALAVCMPLSLVLGSHQTPGWQLASTLGASVLGGGLLLWLWREPHFASVPTWAIIGLAVLLRLMAVLGQPLLEDDYFRYLWDGYQLATTGDPYRLAPSAFFGAPATSPIWQTILSGINYPEIPTIYGPVLEGLFALAYAIAPARLGAIQLLLLGIDVVLLWILARAGVKARWLLAYALHPLILKEAMGSAHPDGVVGLFLVLTIQAWRGGHARSLGIAMGLAVATKVSALVVLPLVLLTPAPPSNESGGARQWVWAVRVLSSMALCLCLVYLPFAWRGGNEFFALRQFGSDWRFNPLLFRFFEAALPAAWARPTAAAAVAAAVAFVALRWRQRLHGMPTQAPAPPVDVALVLLLLLSPVVNPWYWLWALAPAVLLGNVTVLGVAACSVVSYVISDHFLLAGTATRSEWWFAPWMGWACALFQLGLMGLLHSVVRRPTKNGR
jgi:hypothetical protein